MSRSPPEARQSHKGITNDLQLEVSLSTGSVVAALLQARVPSMVGGVIYEAQVLHISTEGASHTSANLSRDGAFVEGRHLRKEEECRFLYYSSLDLGIIMKSCHRKYPLCCRKIA